MVFRIVQLVLLAILLTSTGLYVSRVIVRGAARQDDRQALLDARARQRPRGESPAMTPARPSPRPAPTRSAADARTLAPGTPIGMLRIPRLGLEANVREGVDEDTLAVAAGRIPGTSRTPREGNLAVAAHRDTHFRPLRNVRLGDEVRLETPDGTFAYQVTDLVIVDPEDVWVLNSAAKPSLTLITCYPFTYVGNAPRRFVVRATRVGPTPSPGSETRRRPSDR
jgi:sortase A